MNGSLVFPQKFAEMEKKGQVFANGQALLDGVILLLLARPPLPQPSYLILSLAAWWLRQQKYGQDVQGEATLLCLHKYDTRNLLSSKIIRKYCFSVDGKFALRRHSEKRSYYHAFCGGGWYCRPPFLTPSFLLPIPALADNRRYHEAYDAKHEQESVERGIAEECNQIG